MTIPLRSLIWEATRTLGPQQTREVPPIPGMEEILGIANLVVNLIRPLVDRTTAVQTDYRFSLCYQVAPAS